MSDGRISRDTRGSGAGRARDLSTTAFFLTFFSLSALVWSLCFIKAVAFRQILEDKRELY